MNTLKDKILADIHSEHITPRPKWQFIALHVLLWGSCIITLLVGIMAVSFVFLEIHMPDRQFMDWMNDRPILIMRLLPFIWGIGAIIALSLVSLLFSHTGRGYRYSVIGMMAVLVLGSLVGGWIFYATHVPHFGERQMQRFVGKYGDMRTKIRGEAPKPEDGHLPIRIQSHIENIWTGESMDGKIWQVTLICKNEICKETAKQIPIDGPPILFLGKVTEELKFQAEDLRLPPRNFDERRKIREEFEKERQQGKIRPQEPEEREENLIPVN